MKRLKGPKKTQEWEEALSGTLTGEKVEYIKRGKLKKTDYKYLLELINDCVVNNLNASLALFKEGREDLVENLYRLEVLADTVQRVYFFRHLSFIKKADAESLSLCIKSAVDEFVRQIENIFQSENADLQYHVSELKRLAA